VIAPDSAAPAAAAAETTRPEAHESVSRTDGSGAGSLETHLTLPVVVLHVVRPLLTVELATTRHA